MVLYLTGTDVLGAEIPPQYIVISYKDIPKLVQSKGGSAGKLVATLAPQTIANKVYNETRDQLIKGFKDQGADVDVQIVSALPATGPQPKSDLLTGAAIGVGITVVGGVVLHFVKQALGVK